MNNELAGKMLRVIADLNATTIGVLDGLDPIIVLNDLDEAEAKLRELRLSLYRGAIHYELPT